VAFPKGFEIKAGEKTTIPIGSINDSGGMDFTKDPNEKEGDVIRTMDIVIDDVQTEPTIKLCVDFFNYLSNLVSECIQKFGD
jgi:hypothetical protein